MSLVRQDDDGMAPHFVTKRNQFQYYRTFSKTSCMHIRRSQVTRSRMISRVCLQIY
jgi:hypothetical protein